MKIHEYQVRQLFEEFGIPVPRARVCTTPEDAKNIAQEIGKQVVIKAQVLAGGRGKAGGVRLAQTPEETSKIARQILGMDVKGSTVKKLLVAEALDISREYYLAFINDRSTKTVMLMLSEEGGIDIEEIAKTSPEKIIKYPIDPVVGLFDYQVRKIALSAFSRVEEALEVTSIIKKLYKLYIETDATIAEINPLAVTSNGELKAIDGKMNFDDNALFRQTRILAMREPDQDEILEIEAQNKGLSYVRLDGNIGCIVNGAGLAMATMDMIKLYGGSPANFLDIGGSSNPQKVVDAMNILLSDKNVKSIIVNIFGGITRCDDVARGLLEALETIQVKIPIVVRLSGTNASEGLKLLKKAKLPVVSTMSEAARKAIELSEY